MTSEFLIRTVVIGIGATAVMDLWALLLQFLLRIPPANWAMVGRWVGHFPRGRFRHENIAQAPEIRGELAMGWATHYGTGVVYAALLLAICGLDWARRPTLLPALILGVATLVAPFLLLQPGMGLGVAGARTPNPNATRLRSALNHTVFGAGLYVSALISARVISP